MGHGHMMESVGRPINVERSEKPTLEQVHAVQKLYIEELMRCVYMLYLFIAA